MGNKNKNLQSDTGTWGTKIRVTSSDSLRTRDPDFEIKSESGFELESVFEFDFGVFPPSLPGPKKVVWYGQLHTYYV
jgi:hypothetical protein